MVTLIIISIVTLRLTKLPIHISISLLYLSKIIAFISIIIIIYLILKKQNIKIEKTKENILKYKNEIKEILTNNNHKSIINIIKNSYYYISIIILYMILSTKYSYSINHVTEVLTFIYLFAITIIDFITNIVISITKNNDKKINIISHILNIFK